MASPRMNDTPMNPRESITRRHRRRELSAEDEDCVTSVASYVVRYLCDPRGVIDQIRLNELVMVCDGLVGLGH